MELHCWCWTMSIIAEAPVCSGDIPVPDQHGSLYQTGRLSPGSASVSLGPWTSHSPAASPEASPLLPLVFLALVTQVSSNAKGAQMSVTAKTWETTSFTCDFTQDVKYIHLYKQQEGMAPRRLFYYDVYYSKIEFESGIDKAKYSVYKGAAGRSYRFAILNLEHSDSGMYYCAVWDKHAESLCNSYIKNFNVGTKLVVTDRNLATDLSPKPIIFLPSIAEINHSKTGTYLCLLEKFFPDIIKVYWKEKDGNRALPSQQGNTMNTTDTYMKLSWLTVTENSMDKEHICVVQHERNIRGINQEILFPSINEVVSSIVPTTESPSDCLNQESKVTGTGSKKACLKDESEVTADNNSTKVCLEDESNTLQLQLMNTSAYYTYLLLLLKSVVYFIIITSCVFRRTGMCCDGKNL
ncbi:hypothetical protein R6Z07M_005976 [Ovis aries]